MAVKWIIHHITTMMQYTLSTIYTIHYPSRLTPLVFLREGGGGDSSLLTSSSLWVGRDGKTGSGGVEEVESSLWVGRVEEVEDDPIKPATEGKQCWCILPQGSSMYSIVFLLPQGSSTCLYWESV